MVRTQIYLTEQEKSAVRAIAAKTGRKESEIIRHAVDEMILKFSLRHREETLSNAAGIWRDRSDLPDFARLRDSWNRTDP